MPVAEVAEPLEDEVEGAGDAAREMAAAAIPGVVEASEGNAPAGPICGDAADAAPLVAEASWEVEAERIASMNTWIWRLSSRWSGSIEVGLAGSTFSQPVAVVVVVVVLVVPAALDRLDFDPFEAAVLVAVLAVGALLLRTVGKWVLIMSMA